MSEYTKGPWTVNKEFGMQGMIEADQHPVAATCGYASPKGREANANLIAAAPELFEALVNITDRYIALVSSGDCGFWDEEDEDQVIKAKEAIAKAKGES